MARIEMTQRDLASIEKVRGVRYKARPTPRRPSETKVNYYQLRPLADVVSHRDDETPVDIEHVHEIAERASPMPERKSKPIKPRPFERRKPRPFVVETRRRGRVGGEFWREA